MMKPRKRSVPPDKSSSRTVTRVDESDLSDSDTPPESTTAGTGTSSGEHTGVTRPHQASTSDTAAPSEQTNVSGPHQASTSDTTAPSEQTNVPGPHQSSSRYWSFNTSLYCFSQGQLSHVYHYPLSGVMYDVFMSNVNHQTCPGSSR